MSGADQTARPPATAAVWAIAAPAMATNIATALFGMADTWVIGRLGDAAAQGAVEIGAKLLMTVLIVFNFLRSGTVGLTARAAGRGDDETQAATLTRGVATALAIGAVLLALRPLVVGLGLQMLGAGGRVALLAGAYVDIRYWGSAAWLVNAALSGWLIGRRRLRTILAIEVASNLVHVSLDLTFVLGFGWGVAGVAAATLISETVKLAAAVVATLREPPARRAVSLARRAATWRAAELIELFRMNRDLLARTALLMTATVLLTRAGARQGPVILAVNAILYQLFSLSALFLDGFENAAQVLCGEALGAGDRRRFEASARAAMAWGFAAAAGVSLIYLIGARGIAAGFSTDARVIAASGRYALWAAALPIAGVASFVFDGVFIGSSWTRAMMLTMAAALAGFAAALWLFGPLGDDGLWLAFSLFFILRAIGQAALAPGLTRRAFAARD